MGRPIQCTIMTTPELTSAFVPIPSDALVEDTITLIEQLTAVSSATGDHDGVATVATLLAEALTRAGLTTVVEANEVDDAGAQPVLRAWVGPQPPARPLLLVGHVDTVLPAWTPHRQSGRLMASGAADMKGGLSVLVGALHLLRTLDRSPPSDLLLVVVPDEETLGPVTAWAMRHFGAIARGVWVLEPGKAAPTRDGRDDGESIVGRRRGMVHWRLHVRGRGAHAGNAFWHGRSALAAAGAWSAAAEALSEPGDGPTINPGRLVAGDTAFVDALDAQAHLLGTNAQINIVPNRAIVEGEARFLRRVEGEQVVERLRRSTRDVARRHHVAASFEATALIPPLEPHPRGRQWAERAVQLARHAGWHLEVESSRGGLSFPNVLPDPAAVPVLDGLGPVGDGLHTRDEYVDLRSVARRIGLLAALLADEADR